MEPFTLPTAPVVYAAADTEGKLCSTCAEFLSRCPGSETGVHPTEIPTTPVNEQALATARRVICDEGGGYLIAVALPLAIRLRVVSEGRTVMDLENMPSVEPRVDKAADPKALTRMYLRSFARNMMTLRRLHIEGAAVDSACLDLMFLVEAQKNCVAGLLAGMDSTSRRTSIAGARGRKKVGDRTRDRVRNAAQKFRGQISKEAAAAQISEQIGVGTAHIRRLLSSLFPGDSWSGDRSTDLTQRTG